MISRAEQLGMAASMASLAGLPLLGRDTSFGYGETLYVRTPPVRWEGLAVNGKVGSGKRRRRRQRGKRRAMNTNTKGTR